MKRWYDDVSYLYDAQKAKDLFTSFKIRPVINCAVAAWASNTFTAKNLDEALRSKDFNSRFKQMFVENIKLSEHAHKRGQLSKEDKAAIEFITAEYPKVLVDEVGAEFTKNQIDDFKDAGGIHLPFPAILLCGFNTDANNLADFKDGNISKESTLADGISSITTTYLHEHEDNIHAIITAISPVQRVRSFVVLRIEYDKTTRKIDCSVKSFIGQREGFILNEGAFKSAISKIIYCIHKMTFSDDEVRIAVPTPKEKQVNRKRIRSNKAPLIEFRLIKIAQPKSQLPSLPQGTHASPRQHWRRGHWRHLSSGKRVFVKPMLVGDEKNGKIIKDYIVEEPAHAH
jgi:hypothetical protein